MIFIRCKSTLFDKNPLNIKPGAIYKGDTIRILGGGVEINISVGEMGEINQWPQGMVKINILSTKEVEINIK